MPENRYQEPNVIPRDEAVRALQSGDPGDVCFTLVCLALHDPDPIWLETTISPHLKSSDPAIRGVAATCIGHIARIHRVSPSQGTVLQLEVLLKDALAGGQAEDALGDITMFTSSGG